MFRQSLPLVGVDIHDVERLCTAGQKQLFQIGDRHSGDSAENDLESRIDGLDLSAGLPQKIDVSSG